MISGKGIKCLLMSTGKTNTVTDWVRVCFSHFVALFPSASLMTSIRALDLPENVTAEVLSKFPSCALFAWARKKHSGFGDSHGVVETLPKIDFSQNIISYSKHMHPHTKTTTFVQRAEIFPGCLTYRFDFRYCRIRSAALGHPE